MRKVLFAFIGLFFWCSIAFSGDSEPLARPITEADTVLAIYNEDWGLHSSGQPILVLAVWSDGKIIWSKNKINGGAPYFSGHIDPKRVTTLFANLDRDGLFSDKNLPQSHFGPDSAFTAVLLKSGKKQLQMQSWHELAESRGSIVTHRGIESIQGRRRLQILQEEPKEYLYFLFVWNEIQKNALRLIPNQGKPVDGKLLMKARVISWQESPGKP